MNFAETIAAYIKEWAAVDDKNPIARRPAWYYAEELLKAVNLAWRPIISAKNEATEYPYWMILDPVQMMKPNIYALSGMIDGPFFSRQAAADYLHAKRHNYTDRAKVFCCSGHKSRDWRELSEYLKEAE